MLKAGVPLRSPPFIAEYLAEEANFSGVLSAQTEAFVLILSRALPLCDHVSAVSWQADGAGAAGAFANGGGARGAPGPTPG